MEKKNRGGRPKKEIKNQKNFRITFKLSENEKELFTQRFKSSGYKTFSHFILDSVLKNKVSKFGDYSQLELFQRLNEYITEINRIGTNINQITKKINAGQWDLNTENISFDIQKIIQNQIYIQTNLESVKGAALAIYEDSVK